ncbi:hypothetical protein E2562_004121 [Oryza meyeriana var. granulata]|uniref:Uncharacterized protein n=1 Tax=Oryza meyeriana var. granulata TaxID=110450 RepID=A0A6G1EV52_9ORYZ|nr:hypothetical protein E2562_004121 [Oryza meyeriana var. granulata]
MDKSLYPRVDVEAIGEGFVDGTTPEHALALINEDLVEELRETTLTGLVELDERRSTLACLEEGRQKLEVLVHAAKAVYDRDVAEVEPEHPALEAKRIEAITVREEATKATKEL